MVPRGSLECSKVVAMGLAALNPEFDTEFKFLFKNIGHFRRLWASRNPPVFVCTVPVRLHARYPHNP